MQVCILGMFTYMCMVQICSAYLCTYVKPEPRLWQCGHGLFDPRHRDEVPPRYAECMLLNLC